MQLCLVTGHDGITGTHTCIGCDDHVVLTCDSEACTDNERRAQKIRGDRYCFLGSSKSIFLDSFELSEPISSYYQQVQLSLVIFYILFHERTKRRKILRYFWRKFWKKIEYEC